MREYAQVYQKELFENVIPFWVKHSKDHKNGGYFSCLDRKGAIYDTDKFVWLQARQIWMMSTLYHKVEKDPRWMDMALHGADFLEKFGRDESGNWFFSLDRIGRPLVQPYNIFSDCFAAMGFGALYKISCKDKHADIAKTTFDNILARRGNPKGKYDKTFPGTRSLKNFALPMILSNLALELEHLLDKSMVEELVEEVVHEVMEIFYHEDHGLIQENVLSDGSFSNSFEGRLINPGHAIEAMWFIMDIGIRRNDAALVRKASDIAIRSLEYGWDKEHGGIYYFLDINGSPPQQLEWNQKLWWVHLETLVCLSKIYQYTGNPRAKKWFIKLHEYTWNHFRDDEYSEWYGYLNREGNVLLPLKGGKWKGCFHVPRALFQTWKALQEEPVVLSNFQKEQIIKY